MEDLKLLDIDDVANAFEVSTNLIRKLIKQKLISPQMTRNPRRVKKYIFTDKDTDDIRKILLSRELISPNTFKKTYTEKERSICMDCKYRKSYFKVD